MFLDVRLDVANAFVFENLIDSDENAGLLNVSEAIIDGSAEELHSRTEVHVCVDEWWDVESERTDAAIENAVILLEITSAEDLSQFLLWGVELERLHWGDETLLIVEIFLEEIEDHVTSRADVAWVHRHLSEVIAHLRIDDHESAEAIP